MILVTGGAGYIGSHVNKELHKEGYDTVACCRCPFCRLCNRAGIDPQHDNIFLYWK